MDKLEIILEPSEQRSTDAKVYEEIASRIATQVGDRRETEASLKFSNDFLAL